MEHTPTLYAIRTNARMRDLVIESEQGEHVCTMVKGPQAQANGEFIVRACNSHAELLEALEDALHYVLDPNADHNITALTEEIEAALSKAKGEANA